MLNDPQTKIIFKIFFSVVGLMLLVIGWIFTQINNTNYRVEANRTETMELKGDIKAIKSDVSWIKSYIQNNK